LIKRITCLEGKK